MEKEQKVTLDANTAVGRVAHALSEVISIYPITPSSPMAETADELSAKNGKNIWGTIPDVVEMQSEAGASGAVHGALTAGALSTTFTASQGLLLMIPNMYKIAGELTSTVFHVSARAVATNALSIFGDHSDVMACRQTGWAMLASNSVQEAQDLAVIAHAATLRTRVPFLHFFDGFRTSHEIQKYDEVSFDVMHKMVDDELVRAHRDRGLNPEKPVMRGTAQNPDVYFQGREAVSKYYKTVPAAVQKEMDKYGKLTGRKYKLYEYVGDPKATKVMIIMGSGADTAHETVEYLNENKQKVGVVKVRLYRPFAADKFLATIPETAKKIVVLDRTKEPGSLGEPLYEDVCTAFEEAGRKATIVGGRYGIGSKEFTPAMVIACFDNLDAKEKMVKNFTVGIKDDVMKTSLKYDENFFIAEEGMTEAMFYGLGSDGTVGANKIAIKIIGDARPDLNAQAYFSYDSKKSGGITVSHLRFGKNTIRRPYLITAADFLACHKFAYMDVYDMLAALKPGGVFLLNSRFDKDHVWNEIPIEQQKRILAKKAQFYVIDAFDIAEKAGMGNRINIVMLAAFFKISGVLKEDEAVKYMKKFIEKTYGKKGEEVVKKNISTIDMALAAVHKVDTSKLKADSKRKMLPSIKNTEDKFIKDVLGAMAAQQGDKVPVSKIPADGTYPTGTTQYEKRGIGEKVAAWDPETCITCGQCALVCPHACIRMKTVSDEQAGAAPKGFKIKEMGGKKYVLAISAEDCTGCGLCVYSCKTEGVGKQDKPVALHLEAFTPEYRDQEEKTWEYFMGLPEVESGNLASARALSMKRPLFEFSGACAGCGETAYIKIISQLFGDRAMIANATGCSSIYGGNLPTTPYAKNAEGRGPVWSNSLFEDAAEFGMGMRLTVDKLTTYAHELAAQAKESGLAAAEIDAILANAQSNDAEIEAQRKNVAALRAALKGKESAVAKELNNVADYFIKRSNWIIGGDGWAYDIGFGGLDHALASGRNINILCLDTEVYSNTGGQMSKASPIGAIAKFAAAGKDIAKKDLGAIAMSYGYIYVAKIAMGADPAQTIKAIREAESYNGPSLIIAYAHCINHGINMADGLKLQKQAVECGLWPLYRYDPRRKDEGKNPFQLDMKNEPNYNLADYMYAENRFKALKAANPDRASALLDKATKIAQRTWKEYEYLAKRDF